MSEKLTIRSTSFNEHTREASGKKSSFFHPSFFIQPKLAINQPNDMYEQEADITANHAMHRKEPATHQTFFAPISNGNQQKIRFHPTTGKIIQRQSKDEEAPPSPPVLKPIIQWDDGRKMDLTTRPEEVDQTVNATDPLGQGHLIPPRIPNFREANLVLIGKGILNPADYSSDFGDLWQETFQLVVDWRLGTMANNVLKKIPLWLQPDLEGLDIDTYITNELVLKSLGSSNSRDNPEFNEGTGVTIPLYKKTWRF